METKLWYESRTLWANLFSGLASLFLVFGIDLGLTAEQQGSVVTGVMVVVNVIMRFITKSPVALTHPAQEDPHENL